MERHSQEGRRREWYPPTVVAGWIEESELPEGIILRQLENLKTKDIISRFMFS